MNFKILEYADGHGRANPKTYQILPSDIKHSDDYVALFTPWATFRDFNATQGAFTWTPGVDIKAVHLVVFQSKHSALRDPIRISLTLAEAGGTPHFLVDLIIYPNTNAEERVILDLLLYDITSLPVPTTAYISAVQTGALAVALDSIGYYIDVATSDVTIKAITKQAVGSVTIAGDVSVVNGSTALVSEVKNATGTQIDVKSTTNLPVINAIGSSLAVVNAAGTQLDVTSSTSVPVTNQAGTQIDVKSTTNVPVTNAAGTNLSVVNGAGTQLDVTSSTSVPVENSPGTDLDIEIVAPMPVPVNAATLWADYRALIPASAGDRVTAILPK